MTDLDDRITAAISKRLDDHQEKLDALAEIVNVLLYVTGLTDEAGEWVNHDETSPGERDAGWEQEVCASSDG